MQHKKKGNILPFLFDLAGSVDFMCAADRTLPVTCFMVFLQEAKFLEVPIRIVILRCHIRGITFEPTCCVTHGVSRRRFSKNSANKICVVFA